MAGERHVVDEPEQVNQVAFPGHVCPDQNITRVKIQYYLPQRLEVVGTNLCQHVFTPIALPLLLLRLACRARGINPFVACILQPSLTARSNNAAAALDDFFEGGFGVHVPFPGVFEGRDLGAGAGAVFFGEEDVVVPGGC
ncbi:MAG: hypothetical protein WBQ03_04945 [Candidatus Sulfotelmatobacter sp.]